MPWLSVWAAGIFFPYTSCLQVTFQACNIEQGRLLYDQLTPLTPIMLALSACSPIYRGYVSDVDCRWDVISASVDDRTDEELTVLLFFDPRAMEHGLKCISRAMIQLVGICRQDQMLAGYFILSLGLCDYECKRWYVRIL
jgi:hypothetical protein